jgi:hypothetical protein
MWSAPVASAPQIEKLAARRAAGKEFWPQFQTKEKMVLVDSLEARLRRLPISSASLRRRSAAFDADRRKDVQQAVSLEQQDDGPRVTVADAGGQARTALAQPS